MEMLSKFHEDDLKIIDNLSGKITPEEMRQAYSNNKEFFYDLFMEEFLGHIPVSVKEPTITIFRDHAEQLERWLLYQSYYVNRKAIRDKDNIKFYDGMMIFLKIMYVMSSVNRSDKALLPKPKNVPETPEKPWVDTALESLKDFRNGFNKTSEDSKASEGDVV